MKKIILANALINNGNRGCVALSYCAIYLIDHILGKDNYKLYLTDSLEEGGEHEIKFADKNIQYESITLPKIYTLKGLIKSIINIRKMIYPLCVFKQAKTVFDIGQGDSFADIYGMNRFKSIDYIHKIARFFHKPYILMPQTIGPFTDSQVKQRAVKSICESQLVMSRDRQSLDYVKQIVSKDVNIKEYLDVAFFLPYKKRTFDNTKVHVGLNISALLWNGGYTKNNQFGLMCDYQKVTRDIINYFLSFDNVVLHLIPHVVLQEREVENDYAISFDLYEEYNNKIVLAPFFLSPVDAKNYISGLDFFMGARMHATIAAFSSGVPVVPMAYSRKFNGLFIDTLQYESMVDLRNMTTEEVLSIIKKAYDERNSLRDIIRDRLNGVVEERKKILYNDLSKVLK